MRNSLLTCRAGRYSPTSTNPASSYVTISAAKINILAFQEAVHWHVAHHLQQDFLSAACTAAVISITITSCKVLLLKKYAVLQSVISIRSMHVGNKLSKSTS